MGRKPSRKKNALLNEVELAELKESLKNPPADQGIWTGPESSLLDRREDRSRKSLATKGVGLPKKVSLLSESSQTEPPKGE